MWITHSLTDGRLHVVEAYRDGGSNIAALLGLTLHTGGVIGSIPIPPTISLNRYNDLQVVCSPSSMLFLYWEAHGKHRLVSSTCGKLASCRQSKVGVHSESSTRIVGRSERNQGGIDDAVTLHGLFDGLCKDFPKLWMPSYRVTAFRLSDDTGSSYVP